MPRLEVNFLPSYDDMVHNGIVPTEKQLVAQLVYGLCDIDQREEKWGFSDFGVPGPFVRQTIKIIAAKFGISEQVVEAMIEWRSKNKGWVFNQEDRNKVDEIFQDLRKKGYSVERTDAGGDPTWKVEKQNG